MKNNRTLIKLAIICLSLTDCGVGATTPALATIGAAMPDVSIALIQMIASLPALFLGLAPTILYAPMAKFLKKRSILYIGVILFLIGGIGPAFLHSSIYMILVLRAILGIGIGILTPMGIDLIYAFYEGHEQRTMIGWSGACIGLSGVIFQTLGGFLSSINWTYTFYAYVASAIFFAVAIAFLPEPERRIEAIAEGTAAKEKAKLPAAVYFYVMLIFLNGMLFFIPITNAAYVLLGDQMISSPAQIGLMFNALTVSSIIIGLIFAQLFKALKYHILTASLLIGALGLFLCYYTHSASVFTAGLFCIGLTLGGTTSAVWAKLGALVPAAVSALAIGLGISFFNLGQFFQPIIFNLFTVPGRQPFMIGIAGFIILAVFAVILEKAYPVKANTESSSSHVA